VCEKKKNFSRRRKHSTNKTCTYKKSEGKRYEHIVICKTRQRRRRRKENDYIEFVRVVKKAITLAFLLF